MDERPFGILHTPRLSKKGRSKFHLFDYKDIQYKENGKEKCIKRDSYWRFKLSEGTDLRAVGMSVVCDKKYGHFSLIPNEYHEPNVRR
jgi:hypothetical protein